MSKRCWYLLLHCLGNIFTNFICISSFASDVPVAKAIIVKGQVLVKNDSGVTKKVGLNDWVTEGDTLQTAPQSFIKLLFKDKSQLNVGPSGQIIIHQFSQQEAGIISLVKGKIRAQVTKDLLRTHEAGDEKLYIRTKTASMGIRGTDFQVIFNPENMVTSLVTFEGSVAMTLQNDVAITERPVISDLANQMKTSEVVTVTEGQFSGANPLQASASIPVKISPAQFASLKVADESMGESQESGKTSKNYSSPIPPGISAKAMLAPTAEMATLKKENNENKEIKENKDSKENHATPPPEGFYNTQSKSFAPPAGGFIDLNTGLYLPPPPGSAFDPVTQVYIPPPSIGKFDAKTGNYMPPSGMNLMADGTLKAESPTLGKSTSSTLENNRGGSKTTASSTQVGLLSGAQMLSPLMAMAMDTGKSAKGVTNANANANTNTNTNTNTNLETIVVNAENTRNDSFDDYQTATSNANMTPTTTAVTFKINSN